MVTPFHFQLRRIYKKGKTTLNPNGMRSKLHLKYQRQTVLMPLVSLSCSKLLLIRSFMLKFFFPVGRICSWPKSCVVPLMKKGR